MLNSFKSASNVIKTARSFLFVPGYQPTRFFKALGSSSDVIILDLEDAVPLELKGLARESISNQWGLISDADRRRILIRVNPSTTDWHELDLSLAASLEELGGVMLPKTETHEGISNVRKNCPNLPVVALVETANGLANVNEIARAEGVCRLAFGHIDFQADLRMSAGRDEFELLPSRWAIVLASRLAGLPPPIDGVTTSTTDEDEWTRDTQASRRLGFGGKLSIHPCQIEGIHRSLAPSEEEVEWAQKVIDAQVQAGGGAFSVNGKMVDAPVVALAKQILHSMR